MLSTREHSDVFNVRDEIYLIFTEKSIFFILYFLKATCSVSPTEKECTKNKKECKKLILVPKYSSQSN